MSAHVAPPSTPRAVMRWRTSLAWLGMALLSLLALALSLAACGQTSSTSPQSGATAATATPLTALASGPTLDWHAITLPASGQLIVAPSDGDVAFLYAASGGNERLWVTRDRGAHWSQTGAVPASSNGTYTGLVVDDTDPNVLVADVDTAKLGASPQLDEESALASFDGGATWHALAGHQLVWQFASYHGQIYAARDAATTSGAEVRNLWVSDDGMRSWRVVGPPQTATNPSFWLDPRTGSLLAMDTFTNPPTLMRSDNGGSHWSQITVPPYTETVIVKPFATAAGSSPWLICSTASVGPAPTGTNVRNLLACSSDGGQTWQDRPTLNLSQLSPKGFTFIAPMDAFALASDGSELATVTNVTEATNLYRLPPGASAWQTLGPLANLGEPMYRAAPGAGVLWHQGSSGPLDYLTASYP